MGVPHALDTTEASSRVATYSTFQAKQLNGRVHASDNTVATYSTFRAKQLNCCVLAMLVEYVPNDSSQGIAEDPIICSVRKADEEARLEVRCDTGIIMSGQIHNENGSDSAHGLGTNAIEITANAGHYSFMAGSKAGTMYGTPKRRNDGQTYKGTGALKISHSVIDQLGDSFMSLWGTSVFTEATMKSDAVMSKAIALKQRGMINVGIMSDSQRARTANSPQSKKQKHTCVAYSRSAQMGYYVPMDLNVIEPAISADVEYETTKGQGGSQVGTTKKGNLKSTHIVYFSTTEEMDPTSAQRELHTAVAEYPDKMKASCIGAGVNGDDHTTHREIETRDPMIA